jgi:hypothetical protein
MKCRQWGLSSAKELAVSSKIESLLNAIVEISCYIDENGNDMPLGELDNLYAVMGIMAKDMAKQIEKRANMRFPS